MVRYPRFDGTQACADLGPAESAAYLPVPPVEADLREARRRCAECRFRSPCRRYALARDVQGIWGGLDAEQRRALRTARGMAEPPSVTQELDNLILAARVLPEQVALGHSA